MRQIKFRAWSKFTEKMIYPSETGWYDKAFMGDNGFLQTTDLAGIVNRDDVIAMQYTGLKDAQGVEVYEGDIIEMLGDYSKYQIVFDDCSFCLATLKGRIVESLFDGMGEITVIGNIYENPELLRGDIE